MLDLSILDIGKKFLTLGKKMKVNNLANPFSFNSTLNFGLVFKPVFFSHLNIIINQSKSSRYRNTLLRSILFSVAKAVKLLKGTK